MDFDYKSIASGYGLSSDTAKILYCDFKNENDIYSMKDPEAKFDEYVQSIENKPPVASAAKVAVSFVPNPNRKLPVGKGRPRRHFDIGAFTEGEDLESIIKSSSAGEKAVGKEIRAPSIAKFAPSKADAKSFYSGVKIEKSPVKSSVSSTSVVGAFSDATVKSKGKALDDWDDFINSLDEMDEIPQSSVGQKKEEDNQKAIKDLLMMEGSHVNDALTRGDLVLAVIPNKTVCSRIYPSVKGTGPERTAFVKSHLLVMHGPQPSEQKWDRGYKSLGGVEYVWPSGENRRLVYQSGGILGGGERTFPLGEAEAAIANKHGKKVKPIYLGVEGLLRQ